MKSRRYRSRLVFGGCERHNSIRLECLQAKSNSRSRLYWGISTWQSHFLTIHCWSCVLQSDTFKNLQHTSNVLLSTDLSTGRTHIKRSSFDKENTCQTFFSRQREHTSETRCNQARFSSECVRVWYIHTYIHTAHVSDKCSRCWLPHDDRARG